MSPIPPLRLRLFLLSIPTLCALSCKVETEQPARQSVSPESLSFAELEADFRHRFRTRTARLDSLDSVWLRAYCRQWTDSIQTLELSTWTPGGGDIRVMRLETFPEQALCKGLAGIPYHTASIYDSILLAKRLELHRHELRDVDSVPRPCEDCVWAGRRDTLGDHGVRLGAYMPKRMFRKLFSPDIEWKAFSKRVYLTGDPIYFVASGQDTLELIAKESDHQCQRKYRIREGWALVRNRREVAAFPGLGRLAGSIEGRLDSSRWRYRKAFDICMCEDPGDECDERANLNAMDKLLDSLGIATTTD